MTTSTLHRALVHASAAELQRLVRHYALNPNLDALLRDTGERTWARLADEDGIEVWLISWPEGTETGWHDHGGSVGAFAVARGSVVEQTWAPADGPAGGPGAVRARHLTVGDSRAFGEQHVHNVRGVAEGRSLTVHAYAPRLLTMTSHELTATGPRPVSTTNDGVDW